MFTQHRMFDWLGWSVYGSDATRVETAIVMALRDADKYVAIRAAKTFLTEGQPGYREHVVAASEDSSIDDGIRQSYRAMINMSDKLRKE